jgi:hypothetical protein
MGKKVYVMSIPRDTATGIDDWTNDSSGKRMKKTKVGRTRDGYMALYDPKVGGLATGLTEPWIENGERVTDNDGNKLTLQDKMERKWSLDKGYLTNRPWRRGDSLKEEDLTYYQKKVWKYNDGSTVLDLDNMEDELGYYVALASNKIANSESEWRAHKWPKATHYIAWENEADELRYKKNEYKSQAFASLHSKDMTNSMKRKFVYLLDLASTRVVLTDEQVHNLLFDYIDKTAFTPQSNIDKFMELVNRLKTKDGRENIEARFTLKKAVDNRVIYEKAGTFTWPRSEGALEIGNTLAEAIEFILNPKKQGLVEELEEAVEAKIGR